VRNEGWLYFVGTYRDCTAFKRKFQSFQANYHYGTPSRELVQQFREICLPEKVATQIRKVESMETAWKRLDALPKDETAFIKDLMQEIRSVSVIKDGESHLEEARRA
jgi:hypothetical protein